MTDLVTTLFVDISRKQFYHGVPEASCIPQSMLCMLGIV